MTSVYHACEEAQPAGWRLVRDGGGRVRGEKGELVTPWCETVSAVFSAVRRGEVCARGAERGAERSEGLVYYQQSSQPAPAPQNRPIIPQPQPVAWEPVPGREQRTKALSSLNDIPEPNYERPRRWVIGVINTQTGEYVAIDSHEARLGRCWKRVKCWSETIEQGAPRWYRRATRKEREEKGKQQIQLGPRLVMLTLTYADADTEHKKSEGWEPNHIRDFMKRVRKELADKLLAYAWVLEMQERGSPHYHVLLYLKQGTYVPYPDKEGWWPHGDTGVDNAKSPFYITKYASKKYQKENLPKGARMFAVWIGKETVKPKLRFFFRLSSLPKWFANELESLVQAGKAGYELRWKRREGGGWMLPDTKQEFFSPWVIECIEPTEEPFEGG